MSCRDTDPRVARRGPTADEGCSEERRRRGAGGAPRRQVWVFVAATIAGGGRFGTASALLPKTDGSRVEVQLDPVSLDARFGAPDAPAGPEQAPGGSSASA